MLRTISLLALGGLCAFACGGSGDDSQFGSSGGTSGASGASGSDGTSGGGGFGTSGGTSGTSGSSGGTADECKKMDIVFVVDNSGSMSQEQENLKTNFPNFIKVINEYKTKSGAQLDYRVAVATSDAIKEKGAFRSTRGSGAAQGCQPGPARSWLERADGDVGGFFTCRSSVGVDGNGRELPIESAFLSVNGANAGFVRGDALIAFVILTDEDEGGSENGGNGTPVRPDVTSYIKDIDGIAKGTGRWAAAAIAGPGPGKCTSAGLGDAQEAKRVRQFINGVGKNGVFSSICTGDLSQGLNDALKTFDAACKDFPPSGVN